MADVEEMQQRIASALTRIGTATEGLSQAAGPDTSAELEALKQALEEEKTVTAQLEERIRGLNDKHAQELNAAQASSAGQTEALGQVDSELQRLRKVCAQLRENNQALREANAAGVAEPHLINKAMLAELEAMRAERSAEVAEATAVLSALAPLLSQQSHQEESA